VPGNRRFRPFAALQDRPDERAGSARKRSSAEGAVAREPVVRRLGPRSPATAIILSISLGRARFEDARCGRSRDKPRTSETCRVEDFAEFRLAPFTSAISPDPDDSISIVHNLWAIDACRRMKPKDRRDPPRSETATVATKIAARCDTAHSGSDADRWHRLQSLSPERLPSQRSADETLIS
jgi:hypothetical protein